MPENKEKRIRRLHPADYLIGENEYFYEKMAARGWLLQKRGLYFSTFSKDMPQERRYRIEVTSPAVFDNSQEMEEEQKALYEECGWHFVTRCRLIHVFTADKGSDAPEFYCDPKAQAKTLSAMRRDAVVSGFSGALFVIFWLLFGALLWDSFQNALGRLQMTVILGWIGQTELMLFAAVIILYSSFSAWYRIWRLGKLYRSMKKGRPMEHGPGSRRIFARSVKGILLVLAAVMGIMTLKSLAGQREYPMPEQADGPYLVLADMGIEGERSSYPGMDQESTVDTGSSLKSVWWETYETVKKGDTWYWIRQYIFQLKDVKDREKVVQLFMRSSIFADGPEDFVPMESDTLQEIRQKAAADMAAPEAGRLNAAERIVAGLEAAGKRETEQPADPCQMEALYCAPMEYIAVQGDYVYYIIFTDPGEYGKEEK